MKTEAFRMELFSRPRVLIVDPHADTRELYEHALRKLFQVITARSAFEGVTQARDMTPHLIVTEIALPGIDGWEMIRCLKRDRRAGAIPIIVLTATGECAQRADPQADCARYLVKPCAPQDLAAHIQGVLRDRKETTWRTAARV